MAKIMIESESEQTVARGDKYLVLVSRLDPVRIGYKKIEIHTNCTLEEQFQIVAPMMDIFDILPR